MEFLIMVDIVSVFLLEREIYCQDKFKMVHEKASSAKDNLLTAIRETWKDFYKEYLKNNKFDKRIIASNQ